MRRSIASVIAVMEWRCFSVRVVRREVRQVGLQSVRCFGGWMMRVVSAWIWRQTSGRVERRSSAVRRKLGDGSVVVELTGRMDSERWRSEGGGRWAASEARAESCRQRQVSLSLALGG